VIRQVAVIGILSVGMTFVILTGGIDLSVGSILALTTLVVAGLKDQGGIVAALAGLTTGTACGLVNGVIVTRGRVQPFIVTLGMLTVLVGVGLTYSGGQPIIGIPASLVFIGRGHLAGVPSQAVLFAVVAVLGTVVLRTTRYGRYVYAVGGNSEASLLSGVPVDRVKVLVYAISGFLSAVAGLVMASHLNVGEANVGKGLELDTIAAVVVGGTSLFGGAGGVGGTVIGVLLIGIINNLLNLLDVPAYTQLIVKGLIIVGAVLAQGMLLRRR
jgi:ribose/xylose/arabinose/galactoside ABC-type transport system permease subunit